MESATAQLSHEEEEPVRYSPVLAREEPVAFPVMKLESIGIFLIFGIIYTLVGYKVVADQHVVNFDALDRLTRAFMVWYNDPPKLAAIGFSLPPISSFLLVPFAAVRGFVTSGFALPLYSAVFAAGTLTFVNRMLAMADMARASRLVVVLLVGINPMFAFYAMNGTGDSAYMFFAAFGLYCLVGWGRNYSARFLIGAGLAMAFAALTKYEFLFWALFIGFLISWALNSSGKDKDEVEGSTIAYLAPAAYALGIWIFFNAIVLGDPFEWVSLASSATPVNAVTSSAPGFDFFDAIGNIFRVMLIFPAAIVAIPLCLIGFGGSRGTMATGFGLLIIVSIVYALAGAAIEGSIDVIELRDGLPMMIAALAAFSWLYLKAPDSRPLIWGALVLLSVIALPTAWSQMKNYPHQNLEEAFTRAISTGDDQEGTGSRGGFQVGIAPEREIARFIEDQQIPDNEILTDNARTYGVIALTGRPELFFDRVDRGDDVWRQTLEEPVGKVEFMLVERTDADLIIEQYPGAVDGEVEFLEVVVSNDRYALLRVLEGVSGGTSSNVTTAEDDSLGATGEDANTGGSGGPNTIPDNGDQPIGSAPPLSDAPPPGSER